MKKTLFFLTFFVAMLTFGVRAQVPVFTEGFEGTAIPAGWTTIDADQDGHGWEHSSLQNSVAGHTGSASVVSYSFDNPTLAALTPDNWLISPAISLNGTSSLSYWFVVAQSYPGDHYGVYVSTTSATDTSAFTLVYEMTPTSANGNWTQNTIDLTSYAGNTVYIAFRHFNCTDMFLLVLDDITVSTMSTEAVIAATPNALNFGIVDLGTSVVQTVAVNSFNNTTPISATVTAPYAVSVDSITFGTSATLPATGGTLYVQFTPTAAGASSAVMTLTAGTANATVDLSGSGLDCSPLALPYTETFETTSSHLGCWLVQGNAAWSIGVGDYSTSTGAFQGSTNAKITHSSNGNATKLISPVIAGATNGVVLHFAYVMRSWAGDVDELRVYSRSTADGAWQQVTEFTDAVTTWTVVNVPIPGNVYQVAFEMVDHYGYGVGLDSVVFEAMSSDFCPPVIGLTADNITATSATLSWTGDANTYSIVNMSTGAVLATQSGSSYNITGLTSETQYTFGVVANCTNQSSDTVTLSFTTQISCPAPTGLAITLNPTDPTVATLSWTENGTATAWQAVLNGDETNIINVNTNPYTFTNLTPDTIYTVKVRAYCSADDQSAWSSIKSFEPTTKTVVGSDNAISNYLPTNCNYSYSLTQQIYKVSELGGEGFIESIDFYNNGTVERTRDLVLYVVNTTKDTFASNNDWINVTAADVQFSGTVTFAPQAWTTIPLNGFVYTGANNIAIIVDDNTGSWSSTTPFVSFIAHKQGLFVYGDGTDYDAAAPSYNGTLSSTKNQIRLVKSSLSGCVKPTGVMVSYTGGNQAVVTWNSDAPSFNINVNGTVTNNVTSPYTLTGLSLATTYTVSLQAVCDTTSSSEWTNPISFTTDACMPENQCTITIEGADSFGDGWNGNAIEVIQNGVTIGTFTLTTGSSATGTFPVCSGFPVSFSWVTGSYPTEVSFQIFDGGSAPVYTGSGSDMTVDSVFFTLNNACPSCLPVADLTVDAATGSTVTISWTGTASSYNVLNGMTIVATVTTNTYTFTGLTPATNYTFGVQAVCSATDFSNLMTVVASTECAAVTVYPYIQEFTESPACWTIIDVDGDGQNWFLYQSTVQSASYNSVALTPDNWLISPQFSIPATGSYEVTWTATAQDQSWPAEHYGVFVSTTTNSDTANFTMLQEWTLGPGIFNPVVDLSAYAGQNIYIALRHFNCTDQFRLSIDEFIVREQAGANQVTINVSPNNPAYGTVTGSGIYNIGDNVTVSATASSGYVFSKWVDENNTVLSTNNPYTFAAATDFNLTAIFLDNAGTSYVITVQVNDSTMGTAVGGGIYTAGEQITLTATPFPGYSFVNWTQVSSFGENVVGTDPTMIITVTNNKTFVANFESDSAATELLHVTLTINNPALGTITPAPGNYDLALGESLPLNATPNAGANFDGWRMIVGGMSIGTLPVNPYTLTVNANILTLGELTVMAVFTDSTSVPDSLTIILNTADATMGTTNPAPGVHSYAVGEQSVISAVPNPGYSFLYWIESATINGMTMSDTLTAQTVSMVVPSMYANMTLNLTAYFEVASGEPCDAPTGVTVSAFDDQSISLAWDANANVESWNVRYRTLSGNWTTVVANTNSYTITGLAANTTYQIQVQANCGEDGLSQWSAIITQATTGLNSYLENNVTLYPNPAKEYVDIRVNDLNVKSMEVYDVYGKLINTVTVFENPTRINVSNLANGMYFVRVTTEEGVVTKTFVKK